MFEKQRFEAVAKGARKDFARRPKNSLNPLFLLAFSAATRLPNQGFSTTIHRTSKRARERVKQVPFSSNFTLYIPRRPKVSDTSAVGAQSLG
jgi:hypothetical protein